jgi:hypothetical protein
MVVKDSQEEGSLSIFKKILGWCNSTGHVQHKKYWKNVSHKDSQNQNCIWWPQGYTFEVSLPHL